MPLSDTTGLGTGTDISQPPSREPIALPAKLVKNARKIYDVFQGPAVGFPPFPAALLTAYLIASTEGVENMGRSEAEKWAESLARLHPTVYFDVKNGNLNGFVASLQRSNMDVATADELREIAALVQDGK